MIIKTFKKGILCLMVLTLVAFKTPDATFGQSVDNICSVENEAFEDGEEIVYKLYYNWNFVWLSAGEVKFKVRDLGERYHIRATGRTYASYEWFYKVRDQYDVYVDKETLLPVHAIRDVHEGGYKLFDELKFNQNGYKVSSQRGKSRTDSRMRHYDVSGCMHDVLSAIYYVRNMDFQNMYSGERIPVKVFMDKQEWSLNVKYAGTETKKVKGLGTFDAIKLSPELITGEVFEEGAEMNVWASNDGNKIPLLIESPVSVGSVKAVLKSYSGLKYNLNKK